ncbi:hypothetical protein J7L68_04140 [bacterium]|nr:hypothetical protein [bacterium]
MKYLIFMIFLPLLAFGQNYSSLDDNSDKFRYLNLGEDTEIVMDNPKEDTVYTIDGLLMDVKADSIAITEKYYHIDPKKVVVVGINGKEISYEYLQIKAVVRIKFVKNGRKFVIRRIRVLKNP